MTLVRTCVATTTAVLAALLISETADAQTSRGGSAPNAQLMQQMQQLASERTSLQADNARMKKELDDLRKERDSLKNAQQALEKRAKASEASLKSIQANVGQRRESTDQELAQYKTKMQDLIGKFRETVQALRDTETEGATAKRALATRDQELKTCIDRNMALYKLNDEVLTRFDKQGAFSRIAQSEPFTKIKRVQLENLIDDYRQKADDQRAAPASPLPNTTGSAPKSAPVVPQGAASSPPSG